MEKKKIIFFVLEDWFFVSHFMTRAVGAIENGYDVKLITNVSTKSDIIKRSGINIIPIKIRRNNINPISAVFNIWTLYKIYKLERPSLVHHVALKPILLGTCAAKAAGINNIVNAIIGFGFIFSSNAKLAYFLKPFVTLGLRILLNPKKSKVIFENHDDLKTAVDLKWVRSSDAVLIRGAGVNPDEYQTGLTKSQPLQVILVARMLKDKGVFEFVEAARQLHGMGARFILVGAVDKDNRGTISEEQLMSWHDTGMVEWWGHRTDVKDILKNCAIACLPSYREGLPKSLLEAMASGIPCITTNVPGCREAVIDGINGILVEACDIKSLADAIKKLLLDEKLRSWMGQCGRRLVEKHFTTKMVVEKHMDIYKKMF